MPLWAIKELEEIKTFEVCESSLKCSLLFSRQIEGWEPPYSTTMLFLFSSKSSIRSKGLTSRFSLSWHFRVSLRSELGSFSVLDFMPVRETSLLGDTTVWREALAES